MSLFICWVLFPLLLLVLSLGCGLLVQRAAGVPVRGVLLVPVGLATIVVATQVTTYWKATTFLATPLVIVLAVAGLALGWQLRTANWELGAGAAAVGVFGTYAAPVVLSGSATFLGYTLLGDTSVHFSLIDWVMHHGRSTAGLAPSSFRSAVATYLDTAYPVGAHTALGAVRPLVGQDVAWVFQPYLAFLAAMTSLCVYAVLARAIEQRWLLALAAFLAAQPGLVYAYALEGSVKEMATVWLIAMTVAVGADYVTARGGLRAALPLAVTVAAAMGVLNVSVAPWIAPVLLAVLLALLAGRGFNTWRRAGIEAGVFLVVVAVLSYPSLAVVRTFVHDTTATLTLSSELGNLLGPLSSWHVFGIWPSGDFRLPPFGHMETTYALIGVEVAAIVLGLMWAARRGAGWPLVFVAASAIGWAYITGRSNAWGDAKALMIASPAIVAAAMLGPRSLLTAGRRPEAMVLAGAIAFGVLWTNAVAYHDVDLAPRARLDELARIGDSSAGQGPTLYTEFEEFAKHFLRREAPSGSNESWQDPPRATLAAGGEPRFGFSSDIDELANAYVEHFRTLVLRRSGSASRPPSNFALVFRGRFYDVWRRTGAVPLRHLALGDPLQPGGVPSCTALRPLASGATTLAYVERPALPVFSPVSARHPRGWTPDGADPTNLRPFGPGRVSGSLTVGSPGRYAVWLQGSFGRRFTVFIDGKRVGSVSNQLNGRGQYARIGQANLGAGSHPVELVRPTGSLYPGDGGRNRLLGPLVLDPVSDARAVQQLPASGWRQLCGKRLDWVEALR